MAALRLPVHDHDASVHRKSDTFFTAINDNSSNTTADDKPKVLLILLYEKYEAAQRTTNKNHGFAHMLEHDDDFLGQKMPHFDVLQWATPQDNSASSELTHFIDLAKHIASNYLDYDGFVVVDSIATIAYTCSYLSFMCENLAKPIVLTGSQSLSLNITPILNDAKENVLHSLLLAGYTNICEVIVCFNKKILRGNRIQRYDHDHNPFVTFNYPQLGQFTGIHLQLSTHCMRHTVKRRFNAFTKIFTNIVVIHLIPQLTDDILRTILFSQLTKKKRKASAPVVGYSPQNSSFSLIRFSDLPPKPPSPNKQKKQQQRKGKTLKSGVSLQQSKSLPSSLVDVIDDKKNNADDGGSATTTPQLNRVKSIRVRPTSSSKSLKGVILSFFGVGNAPNRPSFKNVLKTAIANYECEIVVTCQSMVGGVDSSMYASGNSLSDLNLISAHDMTVECCVGKLAYLLGKGYRGKHLKEQFETNLRGELTEMQEKKRRVVQHIPMDHLVSADEEEETVHSDHD